MFVSWLHPYKEQRLVVVGTEAMAVFDDGEPWERKLLLLSAPDQMAGQHAECPKRREPLPIALEPASRCRRSASISSIASDRRARRAPMAAGAARAAGAGARVGAACRSRRGGARSRPCRARQPAAVALSGGRRSTRSAYVDDGVEIGDNTSIWHFSHILGAVRIGPDA